VALYKNKMKNKSLKNEKRKKEKKKKKIGGVTEPPPLATMGVADHPLGRFGVAEPPPWLMGVVQPPLRANPQFLFYFIFFYGFWPLGVAMGVVRAKTLFFFFFSCHRVADRPRGWLPWPKWGHHGGQGLFSFFFFFFKKLFFKDFFFIYLFIYILPHISTSTVDTRRDVKSWTENLTEVPNRFLPLIQVPLMIQNKTEILNLKTRKTQVLIDY
jgi:hypothetical protein